MKRTILLLVSLFFISASFAENTQDALLKTQALFAKGLYPQAAQAYQQILSVDAQNAKAHLGVGLVLNQLGENDASLLACQKAAALDPKDAETYLCLGLNYADNGNFDEALKNFTKASLINPYFPEAYFNAGICYGRKEQIPQAIASFQKFFKAHPGTQTAFFIWGSMESSNPNPLKEIRSCREAILKNPSDVKSYGSLGITLMQMGKLDDALNTLRKAVAIAPGYTKAYFNLGVISQRRHDAQAARQYFFKAAEIDAKYNLLLASGILDGQLVAYDKEIECRQRALSTSYYVSFSDVYYALGRAYCQEKNLKLVNAQLIELEKLSRYDLSEDLKECLTP